MVNTSPVIIPAAAPTALHRFQKMPSTSAGKKLDAAMPNANATTWATNAGGFMPAITATTTAPAIAIRPTSSRSRSSASFRIRRK